MAVTDHQTDRRGRSLQTFLVPFERMRDDDLLPMLLFVVGAAVAACMPPHNDTWWLLRSGQEMWQTKTLLLSERFSHTAFGAPLHNHEWLTQLIFYGLFWLGGPLLLALFCAACVVGSVFGAWRLLRGGFEVRLFLLVVIMLGTTTEWAIRPQAISLAMLVVAVRLAVANRVGWLPVLCAVWANLHGLVLFGIVVAGCVFIESVLSSRKHMTRDLAVVVGCVLAPMLTPIGWHYWPRVFETVTISRTLNIHEYRSAFEIAQIPYWLIVTVLLCLAARSHRTGDGTRESRLLLMISTVLAVAGMLSVRNIPSFLLIATPAISRLLPTTTPIRSKPITRGALGFAALAIIINVCVASYRWREHGEGLGWRPMSSAAAEAIRRCPDPIFNGFADGGPIMWFVPERRVFVDSRVEAYSLEHLQRSRDADIDGVYQAVFDDHRIRCAVVDANSTMAHRLTFNNHMIRKFGDSQWAVFERASDR